MKALAFLMALFSISALANMEATLERNNGGTKKKSVHFSYDEEVSGVRTYCVERGYTVVPRFCYYRGRRGVYRRICGYYHRPYCRRYESRRYTEIVRRNYSVKFKFKRSARRNFAGEEEYRVEFDTRTHCASVEAMNNSAMQRDIQVKCRKVIVR